MRLLPDPLSAVPVTVNSSLSVAAELAVIVSVEVVSQPESELSEKKPVKPVPRSETLSTTGPLAVPTRSSVRAYVAEEPRVISRFDGEISKLKP